MFHANSSNAPVAGHGRGLYCGGGSTDITNIVQYISIGQRGNSHDFGELAPNEPALNSQVPLSDGNRYVLAAGGNTPAEIQFGNIMTKGNAVNTVVWLGLFKEYLDALVPWEKYGNWGGDGWSNADLVANFAGVGSAYIIDRLWEKKGHENRSAYITIHPRYVRVSLYFN